MSSKINEFTQRFFEKTKNVFVKYNRVLMAVVLPIALVLSVMVLMNSVKVFSIFDGAKSQKVYTLSSNVESALNCSNLSNSDYQITNTFKKGKITYVDVGYTFPVYITVGDKTVKVNTVESTVGDILTLAGYSVDDYDLVEPTADTVISEECFIDYSDVDFVSGSYTEVIPCSLETVYSSAQSKGVNTVVLGSDGQKEVYYTSKTVNGEVVETVVNNSVVLSNAVNGKQIIGTATPKATAVKTASSENSISTLTPPYEIALDADGNPVNYAKKVSVQATGYTYTGHNCSTGVAPQPGYIAVNPKIIPYGTKMYIKSSDGRYIYGYAVAADTGGFIKSRPTNVDLFFSTQSACKAFGRRNVEIYILE